jgi:ammonia channel protein AmtB
MAIERTFILIRLVITAVLLLVLMTSGYAQLQDENKEDEEKTGLDVALHGEKAYDEGSL